MFRGHFIFRLLSILLLAAILIGGGALLFRSGVSQGYALGLAASGKELTAPAPGTSVAPGMFPAYPYYGYGFYRPFAWPFFAPFGLLGGGLFLLFFFFVIGGIFRMLAWGRHSMWRAGPGPHGYWSGPTPPWASQPGEPHPGEPHPGEPKPGEAQPNPGQSGQPKA